MVTSTTVKLLPRSCCNAALAFLQKGQYLNEPAVISEGSRKISGYETMWAAMLYVACWYLRLGENDDLLALDEPVDK